MNFCGGKQKLQEKGYSFTKRNSNKSAELFPVLFCRFFFNQGGILLNERNQKREILDDYFPMPNAVFRLELDAGEVAVYAFLLYCEDRKTYQCHPSYSTIGRAVKMSVNTVKKYVSSLEKKGLIFTEHTTVKKRDGRAHNGSLRYTLKPIKPIEEAYFQKKIREAEARLNFKRAINKRINRQKTS